MPFEAQVAMENGVAKITLSGELDAQAAPVFRDEVEKAAQQQPKAVALLMEGLDYMASAGIRVLIFAKQKMGADIHIYAVQPQPQIVETLEMTGLTYSIEVLETYDPEIIEQ
jgi:anti-anti-sigma factor